MLVKQSWCHKIGSFEHEFDGSLICCETRVHIGVHVDGFKDRYAVLLHKYEVVLFIYNNMLCFVIFTSFHFEDDNFTFFGEEDLYLLLFEFRPFE